MSHQSFETYAGHSGVDVLCHDTPINGGDFLFKFLANTASAIDMSVNATSTAVAEFFYEVPAGKTAHIFRSNISFVDANMTGVKFGGISALSTGLTVEIQDTDGSQLIDFNNGQNIKQNSHFGYLAGVDVGVEGTGVDALTVRWTIQKAGGTLKLKAGQRFIVSHQEDLSGITSLTWMLQGIIS